MYSCGPTVHDFPHIGNLRCFVFSDLVHRTLRWANYPVNFVMNITDVDDKIIAKSAKKNLPLSTFCAPYEQAFLDDLQALAILPATVYPKATQHIVDIIQLIQILIQKGVAYVRDGSVYFSIQQFPLYGKLVCLTNFSQGIATDLDEGSQDTLADFALWKQHKPQDGNIFWDSPWGPGRPGWHIECSAMCEKHLGSPIDIHTGGVDNKFPHHENEIAQTHAAKDSPLARYWLHCEHLLVDDEKMAKSSNNFFTLRDLRKKGISPMAIRYIFLNSHYRKSLNFCLETCKNAEKPLQALQKFATSVWMSLPENSQPIDSHDPCLVPYWEKLHMGFCSDFNSAIALAAVHELLRDYSGKISQLTTSVLLEIWDFLQQANQVLGILDFEYIRNPPSSQQKPLPLEIQNLLTKREDARSNKLWDVADSLRKQIEQAGYQIFDSPSGTNVKKL